MKLNKDDPQMWAQAQAAFESAHHFSTTILTNHRYETVRSETLEAARALQPELERVTGNFRKALVYAVSHTSLTHLMPDWFVPGGQAQKPQKFVRPRL